MAKDVGCEVEELLRNDARRMEINLSRYVDDEIGLPTLQDIMVELARPGRDPRKAFEAFSFAEGIEKPTDLTEGLKLPGIVTNVTAFGAFVDIGVHQDGLVHISQLADQFVKDPGEVVKVGQKVNVTVMEVDLSRNRISLSMKSDPGQRPPAREQQRKPQKRKQRPPRQTPQRQENSGNDWFSQALKNSKKK
jgi:protein Tex